MRAIQVQATGGPERLSLATVPEPEAGTGEVLVRVAAAGLNFIDVYHRQGAYALPLPFIPGMEAAGEVARVGPDVNDFQPGDRVAFATGLGAYAEKVAVPATAAVRVQEGIDFPTAAALMLQGMTAHYLATDTFPLKEGDTALVHAGAGGVGQLLIQLAVARGARVATTVSTEQKAEIARAAGAEIAILYTEVNFRQEVLQWTEGRGVDVVYDSVGRSTFDDSLASLRPRGMLALFGQASGAVPPVDPQRLNSAGSLFLTRPTLKHHVSDRGELERRARELFSAVQEGTLRLRIDRTFPLEEAAEAHRYLEARKTQGKVLLLPG